MFTIIANPDYVITMNNSNEKDTTVKVLRKKKTVAQQKREQLVGTKKQQGQKSSTIAPPEQLAKLEREITEGNLTLPKVSVEFRMKMQRARSEKGWTQQDLARQLNLQVDMIKKYENGTAVPIGTVLAKIKKVLQIT